jgi:vacuolar-type H+-ATPase subunit C/Vma6
MATPIANNLDYLAARLHARRSLLAEGARLDELCRLRELSALFDAVQPNSGCDSTVFFQRRLVEGLAAELAAIRNELAGAVRDVVDWMLVRFEVENLKVQVRGVASRAAPDEVGSHLIRLPGRAAPRRPGRPGIVSGRDAAGPSASVSFRGLAEGLAPGPFRSAMEAALAKYGESPRPFFVEAGLDHAYLRELLARGTRLPEPERAYALPLLQQEADIFNLMLALRGRFHYALPAGTLRAWRVVPTALGTRRFAAMLDDTDLRSAAARMVGVAIDGLPPRRDGGEAVDVAVLESMAWQRLGRLANRAFRRSHMGVAAIVGYAGIRRIEVANLITVSEGIRAGVPADRLRARLIPGAGQEREHV